MTQRCYRSSFPWPLLPSLCLQYHYSAYSKQCFTMCNAGNWVAVNKGVRRPLVSFGWTEGPEVCPEGGALFHSAQREAGKASFHKQTGGLNETNQHIDVSVGWNSSQSLVFCDFFSDSCVCVCVWMPKHRTLPQLSWRGSERHLQMNDGRLLMLHCWPGKGLLPLRWSICGAFRVKGGPELSVC